MPIGLVSPETASTDQLWRQLETMIEVVQTRRHQGRPVSPRLRRSAMRNRNLAAAALHARGMTVRAIAGQLGTYGPSTVHTWISHERA